MNRNQVGMTRELGHRLFLPLMVRIKCPEVLGVLLLA